MNLPSSHASELELDDFVRAFEDARQDGAVDLEEFLPSPGHPLYAAALRELVRVDLEYGWENGCPHPLENYAHRFPALFQDRAAAAEIAYEEFRLRHQSGQHPTPGEYADRFGIDTAAWVTPPRLPAARGHRPLPSTAPTEIVAAVQLPEAQAQLIQEFSSADPQGGQRLGEALNHFPQSGNRMCGFELLDELGSGAFARVFLATQSQLANRLVALKISPDAFFGESQTLAQLQHTHIVPIYSVHRLRPFVAVCMPYFGSVTLAEVLRELRSHKSFPTSGGELVSTLQDSFRGSVTTARPEQPAQAAPAVNNGNPPPAPPGTSEARPQTTALHKMRQMSYVEAVLWIASCLADGLQHAHERGILHRDLKPANILLAHDGTPMLLDFNLAEDVKQPVCSAARFGGTLPYMAPEHLEAMITNGSAVDARADLYALGVILYELLTGKSPFPTRPGHPSEAVPLMLRDRATLPVPPRRLNPAVSPAVSALVLHCLEPKPARRYPSAAALHVDLQDQLHHRPLHHAPDHSPRERLAKWARRHPRLASMYTAAGVSACLIALLLGLLFVQRQHQFQLEAAQVKLDAEDAFFALEHDLPQVQFLLAARDAEPAQHTDGLILCRRHAARFGVLGPEDWQQAAPVLALEPEQRDLLRKHMAELLWFWARGLEWQLTGLTSSRAHQEQLEFALRLNGLARECFLTGAVPAAVLHQRARLLEALGRSREAQTCRELARQSPNDSLREPYFVLCERLDRRKYREALAFLQQASFQTPSNSAVLLTLANCYREAGKPEEARLYYGLGISLDPRSHWALFNRGILNIKQKRYAEARDDFTAVLKLRPGLAEALMNRAVAALELNDAAAAVRDLTAALEGGAPYTRLWFMRATARERLKDLAGAKKDREEGLRRRPTDDKSWVSRGLARLNNKDVKGALADFDQALSLAPHSEFALTNKAAILADYLHRTAEAVAVLDHAVKHYPEAVQFVAARGVYLARLQKRQQAHADAQKALALDGRPEVYYQVAGIYALTSAGNPEDRKEALRLLQIALRQEKQCLAVVSVDPDLHLLRNDPEFQALVQHATALHHEK
jgi:serine/threonine protein kinase/tetratricopeptide (TPR) repeat protein